MGSMAVGQQWWSSDGEAVVVLHVGSDHVIIQTNNGVDRVATEDFLLAYTKRAGS